MDSDSYRSYVVRIRRRRPDGRPVELVRADVEDLLGGSRARLDGDAARDLADDLEAIIRPTPSDRAPRNNSGSDLC